jgi:hypothetical protein
MAKKKKRRPKPGPATAVADAIRSVAAKWQNDIDTGHASVSICADEVIEAFMLVAEEIDRSPTKRFTAIAAARGGRK